MYSQLPKVLHTLAGKPLLAYSIETALQLQAETINIVVGHGSDQVKEAFPTADVQWCEQEQQLGTGDAVKSALPNIPDGDNVIILYGDVPLIKASTLTPLVDSLKSHNLAVLTAILSNPSGYGRITRDPNQRIDGIVEQKDASAEQLNITEINTGILAANAGRLKTWLSRITADNAQQEYYLTDIVALAYQDGDIIYASQPQNLNEIDGINSKTELARTERILQQQLAHDCTQRGLSIIDPNRFDLRGSIEFGYDCSVDINVIFNGKVSLGNNVTIHANCIISDSHIGDNTVIHPQTVLEDCIIGAAVNVGPFARIRPGTKLEDTVRIGNFVELKNSALAEGSKVNHLSYVGDSTVGRETNIGAGVITCNYDGANKHQTIIGDHAFIGSNAQLVAPVTVEDNATIAAGSTITNKVPDGNLAVARNKQRNIPGWQRPVKKTDKN